MTIEDAMAIIDALPSLARRKVGQPTNPSAVHPAAPGLSNRHGEAERGTAQSPRRSLAGEEIDRQLAEYWVTRGDGFRNVFNYPPGFNGRKK